MDGEAILQVKVRRGDVYDAVRNILLNEFKVLPADLLAVTEKKVDARLTEVVQKIWDRWGWEGAAKTRADVKIASNIAKLDEMIEGMVREEVKKALQKGVIEQALAKFIQELGKADVGK